MRNCEQLLGSLGLFAHRIGSLDKLNEALSNYGPENCRGFSRVTVKERKGQQTSIERSNIHVASFSGIMWNKVQYKQDYPLGIIFSNLYGLTFGILVS